MSDSNKPAFAPQLYIPNGTTDIGFYTKGLGAVEVMRFSNDDGSVHVAEFSINGTIFHVHENTVRFSLFDPVRSNGSSTVIGLFVDDVHAYMERAIAAGATEISPTTDYDYGYRQGEVRDPFGHVWMFEKKI